MSVTVTASQMLQCMRFGTFGSGLHQNYPIILPKIELLTFLILINTSLPIINHSLRHFSEITANFFYEAGCNSAGLKRYISEDGEGLCSQMGKHAFDLRLIVSKLF